MMKAVRVFKLSRTAFIVKHSKFPRQQAAFSTSRMASFQEKVYDGDLKPIADRFRLANKTFVVTGGGRGIGYGITRGIAEMGGNVCVMDALPEPVKDFESLSKEFGIRTKYVQVDVTKEDSLTKAFDDTVADFKSLDGW